MPAQQESWVATAYLSGATGPIAAGVVLCLDAAGDSYIPATSANRTAAGRPAACIALTGGDDDNIAVEAQYVGVVPPSITKLGNGTSTYINVSSGGMLARQGAIDNTTVGHCDADGTAYVCFPLVAIAVPPAAGPPTNSLQAANSDGTFRGLAHASGSSDGYIETTPNVAGETVAAFGDIRSAYNFGISIHHTFSPAGDRWLTYSDSNALAHFGGAGGAGFRSRFHRNALVRSQFMSSIQVADVADNGNPASVVRAVGPDFAFPSTTTASWAEYGGYIWPNSYLNGDMPKSPSKPFGGGTGIGTIADQSVAPTAAPLTGSMFFRVRSASKKFEVLFPGEDVTTGWHDVLATGGGPAIEQTVDITSGNQTVDLGNGKIIKVIGTNGGTPTITITPQATTAALSDSFRVRVVTASSITISNAIGGSQTMTFGGSSYAVLDTTPDGISGFWGNNSISGALVKP